MRTCAGLASRSVADGSSLLGNFSQTAEAHTRESWWTSDDQVPLAAQKSCCSKDSVKHRPEGDVSLPLLQQDQDALKKPTIAVDVDEVLAQFVKGVSAFHNEKYGTSFSLQDFHSYNFCDVWGGSTEEAMDKITEFFGTPYFANLEVVPGSQEALKRLRRHFNLVVVTSRQFYIEQQTTNWIVKNFPNTFSRILFGNHWTKEGQLCHGVYRSKRELCGMCGAISLIDDAPKYMTETHDNLRKAILFDLHNAYGWSKDYELPADNCVRCHSWEDVVKHLETLVPAS